MFMGGSLWLTVFSLGCGFANGMSPPPVNIMFQHRRHIDGITLEVLRGVQGIGAAASIPASVRILLSEAVQRLTGSLIQVGILAHSFPPGRMREIAFTTFGAGAPLGGSIGLSLGAVMTQLTA